MECDMYLESLNNINIAVPDLHTKESKGLLHQLQVKFMLFVFIIHAVGILATFH